ncbi:MAG: hypothetical protein OEZ06_32530 [Myxococcales bacterium]|nr:hypothetical protein [Myxococcales bacterium]
MSVIARAQIELPQPISNAFAQFTDYSTWSAWMPASFRPLRGPRRALRAGDRLLVRMGPGLVTRLEVLRLQGDREICWRGGVPGLIVGEHSFFFDDLGEDGTRIRSEEPFRGLLPRISPIGQAIAQQAGAVGEAMLRGFRDFAQSR